MTRAGTRRVRVAVLALCVCAAVAGSWWWKSRVTLHDSPLANVPASAMGLVHVRWPELRASRLWQDVVVARGGDGALRALEEECGFDWSADLLTVTAFAHRSAQGGEMLPEHVAFILTGPLQLERMMACAPPSAGELEPRDIDGVRAFAAGEYNAALLDDGALLVGHVDALRAVIRTLRSEEQSMADVPALRSAFGLVSNERHLSAALQLDERWQGAFEDIVEEQGGDEDAPEFIVAGARVSRGLTVGAIANFASGSDARSLEDRLRQMRDEWAGQLAVALSPLGPALRSIVMETEGTKLQLAFDLDARRIDELIELLDEQSP
ncbi:MAG: hypothetical protein AB8H86_06095 [Polyangiales bacterium]